MPRKCKRCSGKLTGIYAEEGSDYCEDCNDDLMFENSIGSQITMGRGSKS